MFIVVIDLFARSSVLSIFHFLYIILFLFIILILTFVLLQVKFGPDTYTKNVQDALDYLHANVPRAFVNLVPVLDISVVKNLNANLLCSGLHL